MVDDEGDPLNEDTLRAFACELTQWFYENAPFHPATMQEFIATAQLVEHYVSKGGTIQFQCSDKLRATIRGKP